MRRGVDMGFGLCNTKTEKRDESNAGQTMPTVKELIDTYAAITGEPRTRVNQFARRLIDDGLMPKSRGSDIKQVTAASALNLFFAIAFAENFPGASATARQIAGLPLDDQEKEKMAILSKMFSLPPDGTLGEVAAALLDPEVEAYCSIELVRIQDEIFQAKIFIRFDPEKEPEKEIEKLKKIKRIFIHPDPELENNRTVADLVLKFSNGGLNKSCYRTYQIGNNVFLLLRKILPHSGPLTGEWWKDTFPEYYTADTAKDEGGDG